jgi:predicted NUDIX family phosphoesterase
MVNKTSNAFMTCLEENLNILLVIYLNKRKRTELLASLLIIQSVGVGGHKRNIDLAASVNASQM